MEWLRSRDFGELDGSVFEYNFLFRTTLSCKGLALRVFLAQPSVEIDFR